MTSEPAQDLRNRGWGFALVIIALAIIANAAAFWTHKATYLQPDAPAHAAETAH